MIALALDEQSLQHCSVPAEACGWCRMGAMEHSIAVVNPGKDKDQTTFQHLCKVYSQ